MRHRLLVVEGDETPLDASVKGALAAQQLFELQTSSWNTFLPEDLDREVLDGLVAVAVPHTPKVAEILERMRSHPIRMPTLAVLPPHPGEPLLQLTGLIADDFVLSPIRTPELAHRLGRLVGSERSTLPDTRERLLQELAVTQLVGHDATFLEAVRRLPQFARAEMPVLITGETGTGKELCARAIHFLGPRRDGPFIAVDAGALPDHLVENELFGHARGAYTDAHRDQRGMVAMAEGGTLFLDEIDALSLTAQAKILRFLQERSYRPLGAVRFSRADVNVIAASNRDLETRVREKQFRADLFYRLNVLRLHLPPLRERRGDITVMAEHFLAAAQAGAENAAAAFSPAALRKLGAHAWPGNVRELSNVIGRAVVLCEGRTILPSHLALPVPIEAEEGRGGAFRSARATVVASFERLYVEDLLRKHSGNVTRAAKEAEKDRRAFGRLVKKYQIDRCAL